MNGDSEVNYRTELVFLLIGALFLITAIAENSTVSGPAFSVLTQQDKGVQMNFFISYIRSRNER